MEDYLIVLLIITLMFISLVFEVLEPILIFFIALVLFLLLGIIDVGEAIMGFSNEGVLTIAALFILTGALQKSPCIYKLSKKIFGDRYLGKKTLLRIFLPITFLSAFMNNTPLVGMFIPLTKKWCNKNKISHSKLLIPISYISIFGGLLTLIGTSTNLVVSGLLKTSGYEPLSFFQLTKVTWILGVLGLFYLIFIAANRLPDRVEDIDIDTESRGYLIEFLVEDNSSLVGVSIEDSGLNNLDKLYPIELIGIDKNIRIVEDNSLIKAGDTIVFTGNIKALGQLERIDGLKLYSQRKLDLTNLSDGSAEMVEGVVSNNSPFIHKKIDNKEFYKYYEAIILSIVREGVKVEGRVEEQYLKVGDRVLLLAKKGFEIKWQNTRDFYLLIAHEVESYLPKSKVLIPVITFIGVVLLALFTSYSLLYWAFIGIGILFLTKTIEARECIDLVDWKTLIIIAFSFGIGRAMIESGAALYVAEKLMVINSFNNIYIALFLTYLITNIFTELITNNAAAVLAFPIALELSSSLGLNYLPFMVVVAVAASASFSSPYGYQTNLMVYSAGNYRFMDFIKVGLPLNLIFMIGTVILVPILYKL